MLRRLNLLVLAAVASLAGCNEPRHPSAGQDLDGPNDVFAPEAAPQAGQDACSVLRVARELDADSLRQMLGAAAADNLVRTRTAQWISSLAELDAVPFVGPRALAKLRATAAGPYACGVVPVRLLAINDFHGNLEPPSGSSGHIATRGPAPRSIQAGGVEFLATHVKKAASSSPYPFVVAAGDMIGASPLMSALFHDEATVEAMNRMGLSLSAVGNHELDEGLGELRRMQGGGCHPVDGCKAGQPYPGAAFHYLAANVIVTATGKPAFPPYEIRSFRGARVAFVGVTTRDTPTYTSLSNVEGLEFRDEAAAVNALVPEIRSRGVEAIVVLMHEGGKVASGSDCKDPTGVGFEIARRLDPSVSVVITGHTHEAYVCDMQGKLVTSAASYGRLVTQIDLGVDEVNGKVVSKHAENIAVTRDVARDVALTTLLDRYRKVGAPIANRVIGRITGSLTRLGNQAGETYLGDVIADAQLAATSAPDKGGAQIAFTNPGGIRTDLIADEVSGGEQVGEVTYGEAFAAQPFDNTLVTLTLTGAQLDALLEQQWAQGVTMLAVSKGLTYTWKASNPVGERVSDLKLANVPIEMARSYRVTVNAFLAGGGDGFTVLRQAAERVNGVSDIAALESYLGSHSPVSAPSLDRIKREP
ncbi:MAG: 5'-nucleotidase C-terminal domain-containing protein [Deltaproteobacteria bacterium]|nr:5'-nucleotidase C-terminal domain-containing protein [Deltaproteobacteria bacterium]